MIFFFSRTVDAIAANAVTAPPGCTLTTPAIVPDPRPHTGDTGSPVWTAELTPDAGVEQPSNALSMNMELVRIGANGLRGEGTATSGNFAIDTKRPTLAADRIKFDSTALIKAGESASVSFHFSEAVTGLTAGDVRISHGTLSNMQAIDTGNNNSVIAGGATASSATWQATWTPGANTEAGYNHLTVNLGGVTDAAGNTGAGRVNAYPYCAVDTKAPVLDDGNVTINGAWLTLDYTDGTKLDADNKPPPTAFEVLVDGNAKTVSSVDVNADNRDVTLTLTSAVTRGQTVTVSYTDPSANNDSAAIQDAAGNDAPGFVNHAVSNLTPAAAPASSPPPPATRDGAPHSVADQALASIRLAPGPGGAPGSWATLAAGGQNGKPGADPGAITSLEQKDAPAALPQALKLPAGLLAFTAAAAAGSSESFSLYLDPALAANGYWLQDPQGSWLNLASAPYGGGMTSEGARLRLDFAVTDGGPFDADHRADGVITAAGAPAHMPLSLTGLAPDAGPQGFWL